MSRLRPLGRDEVSAEVAAVFARIEQRFGLVPNLFRTYAHFPALLKANWDKTEALMFAGRLPRPLKEMIAVVVSQANASRYCTVAHGMALRQLGISQDQVAALCELQAAQLEGAQFDARDQAVLQFSRKAALTPREVTDGDVAMLRDLGLTDADLVEVVAVMELFCAYNRFADAMAVEVDVAFEDQEDRDPASATAPPEQETTLRRDPMVKIPADVQQFLSGKLGWVATATPTGEPNVTPKAVQLLDDEHLVFADIFSRKTRQNLKSNPRVAITVADQATSKGYQFKGRADLQTAGPVYERLVRELKQAPMDLPTPWCAVQVTVEAIFDQSPGPEAGKQLA